MFRWIGSIYNSATGAVDDAVRSFVHVLINGLYSFLHTIFGLVGDAWKLYRDANSQLRKGLEDFSVAVQSAFHRIIKVWIPDFTRWVTRHILDPLLGAIRWIDNEGRIMWHYLTHPADLVNLIWDYLIVKTEHEAWNISGKLGKFFVSLFAHNMKRFLLLIEDIIHAAL
jgi:hypothetical protein